MNDLDDLIGTLRTATLPARDLARVRASIVAATTPAPSAGLTLVKSSLLGMIIALGALPSTTPLGADKSTAEKVVALVPARPPRNAQEPASIVATVSEETAPTARARAAAPPIERVEVASTSAKSPAEAAPAPIESDPRLALAIALHQARRSHAAALVLDSLTREGPQHPEFDDALPWLARVAPHLPEPSLVIESVGRYSREQIARFGAGLSRAEYDHLLYLLGRDRYEKRDLSGAVALFREVRPGSKQYVQARFFEGVSHVRLRRARPAIAAFRSVISAIEGDRAGDVEDADRMRDLAWLSLGRVYYTAAHASRDDRVLGNAIDAWDRIPESSEHWLDAMFEEAWALFVSGQHERALGRIHALRSPYFEDRHYPEARVLRAVVLFQRCQLDAAESAVADFHREYDPLHASLRRVVASHRDPVRAHGLARSLRRGDARLDPELAALLRATLTDRELERHLAAVSALGAESRALPELASRADVAPHLDWLAAELAVAEAMAVDRAGELARTRMERLLEDLNEQMNAMDAVQLEIHTDRRRRPGGYTEADEGIRIVADQEHVIWPFDGEYWEDELPYYRVHVPDRCGR